MASSLAPNAHLCYRTHRMQRDGPCSFRLDRQSGSSSSCTNSMESTNLHAIEALLVLIRQIGTRILEAIGARAGVDHDGQACPARDQSPEAFDRGIDGDGVSAQ